MARKLIVLTVIATMIMGGCGGGAVLRGPEAAAKAAFEEWAQANGVPYKDVRIQVMESDKAFAKVRIIARFKSGADAPWREKAANIECRNVGGKWQADSTMTFIPIMQVIKQLPPDEQIKLYYESAIRDLNDGNFWETAYKLRQVVETNPAYRDARKLLAKARQNNGKFLVRTEEGDQTVLWLMAADGGERREIARGDSIKFVRTVIGVYTPYSKGGIITNRIRVQEV